MNIFTLTIDATGNNTTHSEIVGLHGIMLNPDYKEVGRIGFKVEPVNPDRLEDTDYDFKRIDIALTYLNSWLEPYLNPGIMMASWNGEFTRDMLSNACMRNNVLWLFGNDFYDVSKMFSLWNVKKNNDTRIYCIDDALGIVAKKTFRSNTLEGLSLKTEIILKSIYS